MEVLKLDELLYGIQDAINSSNEIVRKQYFEELEQYFDENGKPVMIDMDMPYMTEDGMKFRTVHIPKLALMPLSMMKVKEIDVDFKVALSQLPFEENKNHDAQDGGTPPSSQHSKANIFRKQKKTDIQVDVDRTSQSDDDRAHIHIKMEGSEPPEGVMKINNYLVRQLP